MRYGRRMAEFIAATAVRTEDTDAVVAAIARYAAGGGVVSVHPSSGGWTVVSWPMPVLASEVGRRLSADLDAQVSAVDVYGGDFWQHVAFVKGEDRDRFCSVPGYFTDDDAVAARLHDEWAGDAAVLADFFDRPVGDVAPYLVQQDGGDPGTKAFADDEFTSADVWVFVDFWRRMGITYPGPSIVGSSVPSAAPPAAGVAST